MIFIPPRAQPRRRDVDITQNLFDRGYVSQLESSRLPINSLSDMTNMELVQDALPRPRPSLVRYGGSNLGTIMGMGQFIKIVAGQPERWEISLQIIAGVGKLCIRKDGGSWSNVGGNYSTTAWATFCQSNNRVYLSNATDTMSYYDINLGSIVTYSALPAATAPSPVQTGLGTPNHTYRYRISANNAVGETAASTAGTVSVTKIRDAWIGGTSEYVTLTWSAVSGATSYNIYVGTIAGEEQYLATVTGLTYIDYGDTIANPFKIAPAGDSTAGPKLAQLFNKSGQLFGVGDAVNPSYLWYSGTGQNSGDFSPFNGGGYVAIDYGGDTIPVAVRPFRDGKGTPLVTVLSRGSGGKGKLHQVSFNSTTVGDTTIIYPEVQEANGQSGTVSPNGVVEANNSLFYPTGTSFKTTGSKPNVVNILSTDNISQAIDPDVRNLNLSAMDSCVGLEYENKIYWAVPYGTTENSEIWILDLSRRGLWILRWTVAAKWLWLYEDNSGVTHFCALVDDVILEFTRSVATQDDGVPFRTRLASSSLIFDKAGIGMASIEMERFKLLYPTGAIQLNIYGLGDEGVTNVVGSEEYTQQVSFTGWGQYDYSGEWQYSQDVGPITYYSQSMAVIPIEVDEILDELSWEIITEGANIDYTLSAAHTKGKQIKGLYYGD